MELPHIGEHCALKDCNRLDFLPIKCDACSAVFCVEHYRYDKHACETIKNKDNQVPVCPLCMKPVACRRDQLPDITVSEHIDQYCTKNELLKNYQRKKNPAKTNLQACSFKSCKQKDLIYLECNDCKSKYCIKHRHPTDHSCVGPTTSVGASLANNWNSLRDTCSSSATSSYSMIKNKAQQMTKSGQAALSRIAATTSSSSMNGHGRSNANNNGGRLAISSLQGNLSEQEALAIAMRESVGGAQTIDNDASPQGEEDEDAALARAIHESELEVRNRPQRTRTTATTSNGSRKDNCILS